MRYRRLPRAAQNNPRRTRGTKAGGRDNNAAAGIVCPVHVKATFEFDDIDFAILLTVVAKCFPALAVPNTAASDRRRRRISPARCQSCEDGNPRCCRVRTGSTQPLATLTEANSPAVGVAWPDSFSPQQATDPSRFTLPLWAHVQRITGGRTPRSRPPCPRLRIAIDDRASGLGLAVRRTRRVAQAQGEPDTAHTPILAGCGTRGFAPKRGGAHHSATTKSYPALAGGVAWPCLSSPQQATTPSRLTPQL